MKGRKPTPKEIKELTNSRHYDAGVPDAEGRPICPPWLSPYAKAEWRYIVPLLEAKHILDKTDRGTLISYCHEMATLREAVEALQRDEVKPVYQKNDGSWVKNPWMLVARDAAEKVVRYAAEMGCTPTARGRVSATKAAEPATLADQFAAYMEK